MTGRQAPGTSNAGPTRTPGQVWSNWAGNRQCTPQALAAPRTVDDLQDLVARSAATGTTVRPVGAGHSFADLVSTRGVVVDLAGLSGLTDLNPERGTASVRAGTRLSDFARELARHGWALANQGDIDVQTVAGAVSTGTHGTGRDFTSLSGVLREVNLVVSDGSLCRISKGPALDAAALSLGVMGIMTDLTFAVVPAYVLLGQTYALPWAATWDAWEGAESAKRNAEFYWLPAHDTCVVKTFEPTDDEPTHFQLGELPPPGTVERYLTPRRVGSSHEIYPSVRNVPFVECEISIPLENGKEALTALRRMMRTRFPAVTWAVEYRTQGPDTAILSPTANRPVATISVHDAVSADHGPFMAEAEALLMSFEGRPHWGKLNSLSRTAAQRLFPRLAEFQAIRHRHDPHGAFLTEPLAALFAHEA